MFYIAIIAMVNIARFVSIIFHPAILIFILPFLVVYRQTGSSLYAIKWQIFSSVFIFLAGVLVYIGERVGIFSDADISKRAERDKFYLMVAVIVVSFITIVVFLKGLLFVPVIVAFGVLLGVLLFAGLNHLFKISIHSGVACAFAITAGLLYGINAFFATIWILPLIVWARLVLKKHSLTEAFSGAFVGGGITMLTYIIGRMLL